jgi:hypothetical protein
MRQWLDRVWVLGRHAKNHIRFYPNPGFQLTIFNRQLKWSRHYGWSFK